MEFIEMRKVITLIFALVCITPTTYASDLNLLLIPELEKQRDDFIGAESPSFDKAVNMLVEQLGSLGVSVQTSEALTLDESQSVQELTDQLLIDNMKTGQIKANVTLRLVLELKVNKVEQGNQADFGIKARFIGPEKSAGIEVAGNKHQMFIPSNCNAACIRYDALVNGYTELLQNKHFAKEIYKAIPKNNQ